MVEPTNDRGSISTIAPTQQGGSSLHIFRIFPCFRFFSLDVRKEHNSAIERKKLQTELTNTSPYNIEGKSKHHNE